VKKVGLEPGVKERGSYGWREWRVERVRRSGRSMNRGKRRNSKTPVYTIQPVVNGKLRLGEE